MRKALAARLIMATLAAAPAGAAPSDYEWSWSDYAPTPPPRVIDAVAVVESAGVSAPGNEGLAAQGFFVPMERRALADLANLFRQVIPVRDGSETYVVRASFRWDGAVEPSVAVLDARTGAAVASARGPVISRLRPVALNLQDSMRQAKLELALLLATPPAPVAVAAAAAPPPPVAAAPPPPRFAVQPAVGRFPRGAERPDDVAVIIGNADYTRQGRDIPDVRPAHADAEGARLYATQALGIREGNVIFLKDATGSQMTRVFGSDKDHRGQLFDWVKPGKSRVYVYYSGHGAPASQGGSPYLIPTDSDAARIELNGYPLKQLYDNLGKLPADSVTVVLEACFSGISPAGSVLGKASPVFFEVKAPPVPANLTVIAAGAANQMASWEADESSGLFTKYYLKAMAGEADSDKDGRVGLDELDRYLKETLTYFARRHYGRDQNAQIVRGGGR
ncbi:hypothetical protein H261_05679 [Paramagnetospirillum caucaseum]|uniref:Peptidase C14 caspase domain-containing protein n=1 Tax=Paramagnetospirillum caucaseum TaxID=1244869 RepID=M3AEA6_9PROT|nr:caspase family protein [Paramagnetospirillum caucaseum]EME70874.1 hypothetical protein H261_05679 [Paramagnetospirillum caucaseum]